MDVKNRHLDLVGEGTEKAMVTHSSTLAWNIPCTEEPGRLQSMGLDTTEWLHFHFSFLALGEGNGNPLQRSCLENPGDGGAWWAAVYGVAQSRTWLKRFSSSSSNRKRWEWDDLREQHWNVYIIIYEIDHQSKFDAWDKVLRAVALGCSWGMGWGGKCTPLYMYTCTPMADSCECMAKTTTIL